MNADEALDTLRVLAETAASRTQPTAERLQSAEHFAKLFAALDDALQNGGDLPEAWADDEDAPPDHDPFADFERTLTP